MPKGLKIIGYIAFGVISFVLFLYLTFPFDELKDRMLDGVEKGLGGAYEIEVQSVSPRLLLGVSLKNVKVFKRSEGTPQVAFEARQIKLKTSIFSLIFGSPSIKFDVRSGKGRVSGKYKMGDEIAKVQVRISDFDIGSIPYLASAYGLKIKSEIDGSADLELNMKQIIRSSGTLSIKPNAIKILPSKLKGSLIDGIELPDMTIGAGESQILAELNRGAIQVSSFKLEEGDLNVSLGGRIFLSSKLKNFRLNLRGSFDFSEKVGQAIWYLAIIENQKGKDGKYPISIAGRLTKPQIKIGDMTVPM